MAWVPVGWGCGGRQADSVLLVNSARPEMAAHAYRGSQSARGQSDWFGT